MQITSLLDVDVVALEADDELSLLLDLTAPTAFAAEQRSPATLVVVLDRSGSMGGNRLAGAKKALVDVAKRLDPADIFGLVAFDDRATVIVPAGPLGDKKTVTRAIERIEAGGSTDLSAGYFRGLQEVERAGRGGNPRLLLISDGHANVGVTDADLLADVATRWAREMSLVTSTLGFGLGYDERLLGALARGGNGSEHFAEEADTAVALIGAEVEGLLLQSVSAASLLVRMAPDVAAVKVVNDLPVNGVDGGILVELGGFLAGETRRVLLTFAVPGMPALGLAQIASLEVRYVRLPELVEETVTVPVSVNVVPGDAAAGRVPNAVVRTELAYQQAQRAKREASQRLQAGDVDSALSMMRTAHDGLQQAATSAPAELVAELRDEAVTISALMAEAEHGLASRASKAMSSDASDKSRTRGREPRGPAARPRSLGKGPPSPPAG